MFKKIEEMWNTKSPAMLFSIAVIFLYGTIQLLVYIFRVNPEYFFLIPENIMNGRQLQTLVFCIFPHNGEVHLFLNLYFILLLGYIIAKEIRKFEFYLLMLTAGVVGNWFHIIQSLTISPDLYVGALAGSSGTVFGLAGMFCMLLPNYRISIVPKNFSVKAKYFLPALLFIPMIIDMIRGGSTSHSAHLGGFIVGLLYGLYYLKAKKDFVYRIRETYS